MPEKAKYFKQRLDARKRWQVAFKLVTIVKRWESLGKHIPRTYILLLTSRI